MVQQQCDQQCLHCCWLLTEAGDIEAQVVPPEIPTSLTLHPTEQHAQVGLAAAVAIGYVDDAVGGI